MSAVPESTLLLIGLPAPILMLLWFRYYRKLLKGALEYPGDSFTEDRIRIPPSHSVKVRINGKCTIVITGVNSWATIRVNGGPRQKVYKVRLVNATGELEIVNESKVFHIDVYLRCGS
ncbi:MAG: hypothetical protein RXS23_06380 [Metallosphaera yellowstonensis]|jgi:hypothetical protein|uniref:Uncharacterized protein n=1 Tax=Metallosphaera yellowstonensis MK1 TaxID=671065 RepID=H2C3F2_9CREN|nr:hypothetical protein MetMK1DRAFT_00012760 [Metallosphaera yellowstonensis MK1]